MKSLYNEVYKLTQDGTALANKTDEALGEIFYEYLKQGFSPREISQIMQSSIIELEEFEVYYAMEKV